MTKYLYYDNIDPEKQATKGGSYMRFLLTVTFQVYDIMHSPAIKISATVRAKVLEIEDLDIIELKIDQAIVTFKSEFNKEHGNALGIRIEPLSHSLTKL